MLHSILAIFVLPVAVNAGLFDYGLTIMEMNLNSTYKCDNAQLQSKMEACVAPARVCLKAKTIYNNSYSAILSKKNFCFEWKVKNIRLLDDVL